MMSSHPGDFWFEQVPKTELHVHLEGAIPLLALWELIQKYGGDPQVASPHALERRFNYQDFPHFIDTWVWKNQYLREYEDFTFIAEAFARNMRAQNVIYAEAFYSPPDFFRKGLQVQPLTQAIREGLDRVPEVEVHLVADLVRDFGPEKAVRTLHEIKEVRQLGVVGVGLGGSEQCHPPGPFAAVFSQARAMGLHTSAHAGEAAGPQSVWGAIEQLQAERIGHATRAVEDPHLLDALAERQIPLEICMVSNLCTGVVASINNHPVRKYFERGLCLTINTDDPQMFNTSLAEEYQILEEIHSFTRMEIQELILNGIRVSWLDGDQKQKRILKFQNHPAWIKNDTQTSLQTY